MNGRIRNRVIAVLLSLVATVAVAGDDAGLEQGAALLVPFKTNLKTALMAGLADSPARAIDACSAQAPAIASSLSVDGVRMGRSSHRLRNPANAAPDWVVPILDAWVADDADRSPRSVDLGAGRRGYVEAITVQPMCLACHGEQLDADVAERISSAYPEDRATGFRAGDFRGVFWVEYPAP